MIDDISVVSSDLWTKIDAQLTKVFWANTFSFPSVSMMLVGDIIPFPTVKGDYISQNLRMVAAWSSSYLRSSGICLNMLS